MTLLFVVLTLAVLGVVAAVAAGRINGGMDDPASSVPSRGLPPGELSTEAMDRVRFSPALRGYRMDEVDAVLDRLTEEVARRDAEISRLHADLHSARPGRWDG